MTLGRPVLSFILATTSIPVDAYVTYFVLKDVIGETKHKLNYLQWRRYDITIATKDSNFMDNDYET